MNKERSHKDMKNKTSSKDVNKEKQHDNVTTENSHKDVERVSSTNMTRRNHNM